MYAELKQKYCRQCGETKSTELFRFRKTRGTYESYCKVCEAANNKKWMADNKDTVRVRDSTRNLKKFGLTVDGYNQILDSQNNGCAICGEPRSLSGRALAVDHCHKRGFLHVRGLLCNECNTAIGLLKENLDIMFKAISYVKKFKK